MCPRDTQGRGAEPEHRTFVGGLFPGPQFSVGRVSEGVKKQSQAARWSQVDRLCSAVYLRLARLYLHLPIPHTTVKQTHPFTLMKFPEKNTDLEISP